jgi:MFS transporter, OFA family, oxalate/formate antiporter
LKSATRVRLARPRGRIFYGWWIVLAFGVLHVLSAGLWAYGFSTFFVPLTKEFGWTYALTSSAYSLNQLGGAIIAPITGAAFDRFGPRKLALLGVALMGAGFVAFGRADSFVFFAASVAITAAGFHTGFTSNSQATVANWFSRKRSSALGLLMAGAGGLLVPILAWTIENQGWRIAALGCGVLVWLVGFPMAMLVRHRPEHHGMLPDGDEPVSKGASHAPGEGEVPPVTDVVEADWGVRQALRARTFWLLAASAGLSSLAQTAVSCHLVPRLENSGMSATVSAAVLSTMLIVSIVGRIGFGWLGDRIPKRYAMLLVLGLTTAGLCVFANLTEMWQLGLFLLLYAPGYGGTVPLRPAMLMEYCGRRSFGSIYGLFTTCFLVGGLIGPVMAGWVFDVGGTYSPAFWILTVVSAASMLPILAMPSVSRPANAFSTSIRA